MVSTYVFGVDLMFQFVIVTKVVTKGNILSCKESFCYTARLRVLMTEGVRQRQNLCNVIYVTEWA